ncbi:aldo/keto reductase [candidate division KSB1 bacterium]
MDRTRRDFIKGGMLSLAGLSFIPGKYRSGRNDPGQSGDEKKIIYRTLGKTGIKVPIVGMGVVDNTSVLPHAFNSGMSFILSSGSYRNGNSERWIGGFLRNKPRDSFVVATGFDPRPFLDSRELKFTRRPGKDVIIRFAEDSLRRLRLEYIDIYNICNLASEETVLYEPFLQGVDDLKKSGKIRFVGAGTHQYEPLVLRTSADSGVYDTVMTAHNFRKNNREDIKNAIAYAAGKGLGIVAMKTQAGVYWDGQRRNMINMPAALKWALQDENVHTSVPAFSNISEFNEGFSVMEDLPLTPSELRDLRITEENQEGGMFCQQCRECMKQCPYPFDIPTVMRSYMYAYGYGNLIKARETLDLPEFENIPCKDCGACSVKCAMNFDIRKKVLDIISV